MTPKNFDPNNPEDRVRIWLKGQRMYGAQVLLYLMDHANTPIHVSFLDWCTANGVWPELNNAALHGFEAQPLIPMADKRTRKECCQMAKTLMKKIQGAVELGDAKLEQKLRLEYDLLMKYLRQITTPEKRIKNFVPYWNDAYHNIYTCVYKVVQKLAKSHPAEARYVVSHLQKGQRFMWRKAHSPHSNEIALFELKITNADLAE